MIGRYYRGLAVEGDYQVFSPTDYTRGNWGPEIQHGSPPLALLTKLIEELSAGSGQRIGRLSLDILGAIPVTPMRARAWVERPGSRICMIVADMSPASGRYPRADRDRGPARAVARVTAWLLAVTDTAEVASDRYPPLVDGPKRCRGSSQTPAAISTRSTGDRRIPKENPPRCPGSARSRTSSTPTRQRRCSG